MRFMNHLNCCDLVMRHFNETEDMIMKELGIHSLSPCPSDFDPSLRSPVRGCAHGGIARVKLVLYGTFRATSVQKLEQTMHIIRASVMEQIKTRTYCSKGESFKEVTEFRVILETDADNFGLCLSYYMEALPAG